jgi:hypothetical protein
MYLTIYSGSGFGLTMDFAAARAAKCSSCPVKEDMSNYWTPKLYYHAQDGTFQSVPTVGDNINDINGGMTVYYLQRGKGADTKTLKAFPEGFRMLAGDNSKRTFSNDFAGQGVSFACLGAGKDETNGLPNYNCPGGLRAQIFFPSCWDGVNLDSPDHKSHMAYPATGAYNNGACPSTHPVQLISLFYEILYDTNSFANKWYGSSQPFVFANGDPTGYGFHGDFVNGWDVNVLQRVVDECTDPAAQGSLDACAAITQFTGAQQNACRLPSSFNEKVAGVLPALPGCNPVQPGPAPATKATCAGQVDPVAGSGSSMYFTDVTSKGWAYAGCGTDGDPRTLTDKTTLYTAGAGDKMTVEYCIDYCKGYTYAGLEYAGECYCGNTLAADRAPVAGIFGNCNMKCKGNADEFCGGSRALSLYKACSGADCKNAGDDGSVVSPVVASAKPVVASSAAVVAASSIKPAVSSVAAPVMSYTPPKVSSAAAAAPSSVAVVVKPVVPSSLKVIVSSSKKPVVSSSASITGTVTVTKTVAISTVTVTKGACRLRS